MNKYNVTRNNECKYTKGRKILRDVNNRLTGWTSAHLVNYFAHPVN